MKRICLVFLGVFCIGFADAAVRTQNTTARENPSAMVSPRKTTSVPAVSNVSRTTTARTTKQNTQKQVSPRSATQKTPSRKTATVKKASASRAATNQKKQISRAATVRTQTFGENYNSCRDAYFTCMDQFCAIQNENYRRCVCSSRLKEIQSKESSLTQTTESLKDFHNYNIDSISKTAKEVAAMGTATSGEAAIKKDNSASANTLSNISSVLNSTKQNTASNASIMNDIKDVWSTTDLIGGSDIANLTGESLYNAVHAQCVEMVATDCNSSNLNMVASAYGMYIENDCSVLANNLNSKKVSANASIRTTRAEMHNARLENYNAHNSLSLNDCISKVRQDLTTETACGKNYTHCLDVTGKYLNITTGEPIYSKDFYQIENQISLSGNVLKNNSNTPFIKVLNEKRAFAKNTLDLCIDDADSVWNEFLTQALVEIYQGQQQRVQDVKAECLQVVNECYLDKSQQLKNFTDNSADISIGQTLELSEDMCAEKLNTCSNLYGGGPEGLKLLVKTLAGITDATIASSCSTMLDTYLGKLCSVQSNDSSHAYPYGCRTYSPGESRYARNEICNSTMVNPFSQTDILITTTSDSQEQYYSCPEKLKVYTSCFFGYYLYNPAYKDTNPYGYPSTEGQYATQCMKCPINATCAGGTNKPYDQKSDLYDQCGLYYIGSIYQQMVIYALQNCMRPSNDSFVLPESILADVDTAMKKMQISLVKALASDCESYEGTWVDIPWIDEDSNGYHDQTGDTLLRQFYMETNTNKMWGYCK